MMTSATNAKTTFDAATFDFCGSDIARLRVLDNDVETTIHVHEAILCDASPVIAAALQGPFEEGETKSFFLDDVCVSTANALVQWLYTRQPLAFAAAEAVTELEEFYWEIARLYICASKYGFDDLVEMLELVFAQTHIDRLRQKGCSIACSVDTVRFIYDNTPVSARLRKILAAMYTAHVELSFYDTESARSTFITTPEFGFDVAQSLAHQKANPAKPCEVHEILDKKSC